MTKIEETFYGDYLLYSEELARIHGGTVAIVFGKIYRLSQGKGFSYASLQRIAKDVGLGLNTVVRAKNTLINLGFIENVTPDNLISKTQVKYYAPLMQNFYNFLQVTTFEKPTKSDILQRKKHAKIVAEYENNTY